MAEIIVRPLRPDRADAVARAHRAGMATIPGLGVALHTPEEDRAFYRDRVFAECTVLGAFRDGRLVGHAAWKPGWIEHLYVLPDHHGTGIGSALLAAVRERLDDIRLWTFQANRRARRFYERHGFVAEAWTDGDNEEKLPDVRYRWRGETIRGENDMSAWAIDIDRDDIREAAIVEAEVPAIGEGEVLVAVELFAMTANNVTYAVFGKPAGLFGNDQGYWDFFAERGAPGRLPVWGFGRVVDSRAEGIAAGERFYGYWPMASHAVLRPGNVGPGGFTDVTPRRTSLPPIYNNYQKIAAIPDYREVHHQYWPVFRPLFLTGWLIADQYADEGDYGAGQIVVASASSKTAIGVGFSHRLREGAKPRCVGLTSAGNVDALGAAGIYDAVVAYDDLDSLDATMPTGYVDIAGNGTLTNAVHAHFGDALKHSMTVGKSHWDAPAAGALAGPAPEGFFAPGRAEKRIADWGPQGFGERMAAGWLAFMEAAPELAAIDRREGGEAALAAYRDVLDGRADPKAGIVIAP